MTQKAGDLVRYLVRASFCACPQSRRGGNAVFRRTRIRVDLGIARGGDMALARRWGDGHAVRSPGRAERFASRHYQLAQGPGNVRDTKMGVDSGGQVDVGMPLKLLRFLHGTARFHDHCAVGMPQAMEAILIDGYARPLQIAPETLHAGYGRKYSRFRMTRVRGMLCRGSE